MISPFSGAKEPWENRDGLPLTFEIPGETGLATLPACPAFLKARKSAPCSAPVEKRGLAPADSLRPSTIEHTAGACPRFSMGR